MHNDWQDSSPEAHDVATTGVIDHFAAPVESSSGPLGGLTLGVKEIVGIAGHTLTANTRVELPLSVASPDVDSVAVERLRSAGALVAATTVSHEFAWGITTHGRTGRRVLNPHLPNRIAGGSSGGSAVATARGVVDLGLGTDTAGSCRIPAAWCGVFGWKASAGLVPMDGVLPLAPGLDHIGLLAREIDILRAAVAGIGALPSSIARFAVVEPLTADWAARAALHAAVERLGAAGFGMRRARFPAPADLMEAFTVYQSVAALRVHRDMLESWPTQRDRYGSPIAQRLEAAERMHDDRIRRASVVRRRVVDDLRSQTDDQIVLSVAVGCPPPTTDAPDVAIVDGIARPLRSVVLPHTVHANLAGLPAVVVPWTVDGEPVGVQLTGPEGADLALIDVASWLCGELVFTE